MERIVIPATRRNVTGKKVNQLRREGLLPAVLYGHNFEAIPVTLDLRSASKILGNITASSLVTIDLEGKQHAALVREKQRDYIVGTLLHVDFQVVSLTEKIRARVGIVLTGVSPAVKDFNGVVYAGLNELEVESLPGDLPESIMVDQSHLANIGDSIFVRDIHLSDKVVVLSNPDEMVIHVTGQEAEEVEPEAVAAEAEPEVIEKKSDRSHVVL